MPMNSWQWVNFHQIGDVSTWYGDSFAWMRVALREDGDSGRVSVSSGGEIDHHRLNVSLVSAGIAIELMYKVLLIAERVDTRVDNKPTYVIDKLHDSLETRRDQVECIILDEGWRSVRSFLDFMDNELKHSDRKYWMSNPPNRKERRGTGFTISIELMTVPGIARVHRKLATLVDPQKLVAQYDLEHARVVTAQALTRIPIMGHKEMETKSFERNGHKVEYTVYESLGQRWHVPDYVRGWWEMPQESGEPTGKFVFLLNPGEYDNTKDYWRGLP